MKRDYIDFTELTESERQIDAMLHNWSLWVKPSNVSMMSPMFRLYRSNYRQWHEPEYRETCDVLEAMRMEKLVCTLAPLLREAIIWFYVYPVPPYKAARAMFVSERHLQENLKFARQQLTKLI